MIEHAAIQVYESTRRLALWLDAVSPLQLRGWADYVFVYAIAGLTGTVYETIWAYLSKGMFEFRNGSILTPFNYIYGLAALAIVIALRRADCGWKVFLTGAICGGILEYAMSLIQQYLLGSRSWDYSNEPLNIGGRTTVPYMMVWGSLCYVLVRFVIPVVLSMVHMIPDVWRVRLGIVLLVWILADAAVTLPAIFLYGQRADGAVFQNGYARLMSTLFDDNFMRLHFPNMRV